MAQVLSFSALSRAVVGGTFLRSPAPAPAQQFQCSQSSRGWWNAAAVLAEMHGRMFQCSQSSRGWWNYPCAPAVERVDFGFSALSRAVVGGTHRELPGAPNRSAVSVLSVEPWLVEQGRKQTTPPRQAGFSALSRAVVGGTSASAYASGYWSPFQCSQSSRGWWNWMPKRNSPALMAFQCSQSSRGWWN